MYVVITYNSYGLYNKVPSLCPLGSKIANEFYKHRKTFNATEVRLQVAPSMGMYRFRQVC